jgi:2-isopropylmalate synthase
MVKMGYATGINEGGLARLTHISRFLDERLNRAPDRHAAYVGESAFAHKGGLHVSAVERDPRSYEHVDPALVGNARHIVVSDQAGRSNILARLREIGVAIDAKHPKLDALLDEVKAREFEGYAYDGAEASFELLAQRTLGSVPEYFRVERFRIMDERRWNAKGELVTVSEATVAGSVDGKPFLEVAESHDGPVNALDTALRKALLPAFPALENMHLTDFKVRILTPQAGTRAVTRVMIESAENGDTWSTVGVSSDIINASFNALHDSLTYKLWRSRRS